MFTLSTQTGAECESLGDRNVNIGMVCVPVGMGYTVLLMAEWRERDS